MLKYLLTMTKEKAWLKRRTSRGGGRVINNKSKISAKNLKRDVVKNQLIYSKYLFIFIVILAISAVWISLPVPIIHIVPLGAIVALLFIGFEKISAMRKYELCLIVCGALIGYFFDVALIPF